MKVRQEKISKDKHLVAVTDDDNKTFILCSVFSDRDNADTAARLLSRLIEIAKLDSFKLDGTRRYNAEQTLDSLRQLEHTGIGLPVQEINP